MTNEEKQALIDSLADYIRQPLNKPMTRSETMEVARIALAALTAKPVKLPQGRLMQVAFETDPVNADMYLCISRDGAVAAIRAAGYEVIE